MEEKEHWRVFVPAVFLCALFLLIPAMYNLYPFVNPDTATYLASGFKPETPFDRPITYGLLVRVFSFNGLSLWGVVLAQAYIVSWLIFLLVRGISGQQPYRNLVTGIIVVATLSATTSLSWLVCQVQPDVFTPVLFLCIAVLLMGKEGRLNSILLYLLFFLSVATHMAHPLLSVGTLLILLMAKRLYVPRTEKQPGQKLLILIVLSFAAIGVMGAALSKSKHVFFAGTLMHKGIMQQYLADNCAVKNYQLCKYRSELTTDSDYFMWNGESPLYRIGGWQDAKPELTAIIDDVLSTPRYLQMYVSATAAQSAKQAVTFDIGGGNEPLDLASGVGKRVSEYFPKEATQFSNSRQNRQDIHKAFRMPNQLFTITICISLFIFCYMLTKWRTLPGSMKIVAVVCILGIIFNALDCAAFGILHSRYGAKMIWLLPMSVFLFLANLIKTNKAGKANLPNLPTSQQSN